MCDENIAIPRDRTMPNKSRRDFLKTTSIVSLSPMLPCVFGRTARASQPGSDEKILVVVQLDGGNDGINTVVPIGDDGYGRARKRLRLKTSELHKLNDHVGLHRSLRGIKELYDDGRCSIIQGVGYPNPDRSHFRSMKIWQTGNLHEPELAASGWLGAALDQRQLIARTNDPHTDAFYVGDDQVPLAMWGRHSTTIGMARESDLQLQAASTLSTDSQGDLDLEQFVCRQFASAHQASEAFRRQRENQPTDVSYPNSSLGQKLRLVSQLIRSGSEARVFYTSQSGYDTHSSQLFAHSNLLSTFAGSVKAFLDDLKSAGLEDQVALLAFSEFGRRVAENDSEGTDHGTAGPVFLAGGAVRGGLIGDTPSMSDLSDGDLKSNIDFRQIYATLLNDWLDIKPDTILQGDYTRLNLFA